MKINLKEARSRLTSHRDAGTDVSPSRPSRSETRRQNRETREADRRLKAETSHRLKTEARETAARIKTETAQARQAERETAARLKASQRADRDAGASHVPGWVDWLPRGGWPVVAIIVMVMCAPGEHHLARLAGWDVRLAWGMPACLVAYAGIAASVATRRRRGAQGRRTAVIGAVVSLMAAMSAQPVSHLFVTGHWSSDPSPVWLVVAVSCVPPLVLGHLMHMAASHGQGPASRRSVSRDVSGRAAGTLSRLRARRPSHSGETRDAVIPPAETSQPRQLTPPSPVDVSSETLDETAGETETPGSTETGTPDEPETAGETETPDETRELLTRKEAAALASQIRGKPVSPSTISTWRDRGRLPCTIDTGDTLYHRNDVISAAR